MIDSLNSNHLLPTASWVILGQRMSQSCSHFLNRLTSSDNICGPPADITQMDSSGITSPEADPGQQHNALSEDDTQFSQVKTLGWGYISGIEHMFSIQETLRAISSTPKKVRTQVSFIAQMKKDPKKQYLLCSDGATIAMLLSVLFAKRNSSKDLFSINN